MNKLKTFFLTYYQTISNPMYYNDVIKARFSFSLKYFFVFYFLLSILGSLVFTLRTKPLLERLVSSTVTDLESSYPEDLVLEFTKDSLAVSGVEEPFSFPFSSALETEALSEEYDSFIAIDTQSQDNRAAMVTLNSKDFTLLYPDGRKQTTNYSDIEPNVTLTKSLVREQLPVIQAAIQEIFTVLPFVIFFINAVFTPLLMLGVLLILSGFVYLAIQFGKREISYKKVYQLSLHTITFAETAGFLQRVLFWKLNVPSIFMMAFFGATLLAIWNMKPKKQR